MIPVKKTLWILDYSEEKKFSKLKAFYGESRQDVVDQMVAWLRPLYKGISRFSKLTNYPGGYKVQLWNGELELPGEIIICECECVVCLQHEVASRLEQDNDGISASISGFGDLQPKPEQHD